MYKGQDSSGIGDNYDIGSASHFSVDLPSFIKRLTID